MCVLPHTHTHTHKVTFSEVFQVTHKKSRAQGEERNHIEVGQGQGQKGGSIRGRLQDGEGAPDGRGQKGGSFRETISGEGRKEGTWEGRGQVREGWGGEGRAEEKGRGRSGRAGVRISAGAECASGSRRPSLRAPRVRFLRPPQPLSL